MKPSKLSRREILKLASLLPVGHVLSSLPSQAPARHAGDSPNVIIVVFDAMSASNIKLFGYQRDTMPQLSQLSERAIVYRQHFAAGPFTTPGTASLLTGTMPWTHRAIRFNGKPARQLRHHNVFNLFPDYQRIAYSHNPLANTLFYEFANSIDQLTKRQELFLSNELASEIFGRDYVVANLARQEALGRAGADHQLTNSLFIAKLFSALTAQANQRLLDEYLDTFPRNLPGLLENENYFLLEDAVDWMAQQAIEQPHPYFAYFHLWPPHRPYRTRAEFFNVFQKDDYLDIKKPEHLFSLGFEKRAMRLRRRFYDEYLLYVDAEFARLYHLLEDSGALENTWLLLTADHGEMFERGVVGHFHLTLHNPVVHVPLLIFPPGQQTRVDIQAPTSAIDVLPTLLQLTGHAAPDWLEGRVLPPFADSLPDPQRPIYVLQAKENQANAALQAYTAAIRVGNHKLIYYTGYEQLQNEDYNNEYMELYDIAHDPEELEELSTSRPDLLQSLRSQLLSKIEQVNAPYRK